jgi:hypothetical protein
VTARPIPAARDTTDAEDARIDVKAPHSPHGGEVTIPAAGGLEPVARSGTSTKLPVVQDICWLHAVIRGVCLQLARLSHGPRSLSLFEGIWSPFWGTGTRGKNAFAHNRAPHRKPLERMKPLLGQSLLLWSAAREPNMPHGPG